MLKGFFLHWIHMYDAGVSVGDGVKPPIYVYLGPASSALVGKDHASVRASAALDCAVGQLLIEIGFLDMGVC